MKHDHGIRFVIIFIVLIALFLLSTGCTLKPKTDPAFLLELEVFDKCQDLVLKAKTNSTEIRCKSK